MSVDPVGVSRRFRAAVYLRIGASPNRVCSSIIAVKILEATYILYTFMYRGAISYEISTIWLEALTYRYCRAGWSERLAGSVHHKLRKTTEFVLLYFFVYYSGFYSRITLF